jgi:uncharacterized protein
MPRLIVFCKAPVSGEVKTRLIGEFTPDMARDIHIELAERTFALCQTLQGAMIDSQPLKVELWCAPDVFHAFFQSSGFDKFVQAGADLGERMANALNFDDGQGTTASVLIGTDCPTIDQDYILQAFTALADADVVLGPAEDGGYGLVGISAGRLPQADWWPLFENMPWSTDAVTTMTRTKAKALGVSVSLLEQVWDVDYAEDVRRWRAYQHRHDQVDKPAANAI